MDKTFYVPLEKIVNNPWQTRIDLDPDYIAELAADIQQNGLLQYPSGRVVFQTAVEKRVLTAEDIAKWGDNLFTERPFVVQLAIGHNRKAAYELLAKTEPDKYGRLPMRLGEFGDETMSVMAWSENARRKDLTPLEESLAIQRDMADFGWNQEQAAEKLGLNRATIANKLRLLKLPQEVQQRLHRREISERQAQALLPVYQLPAPALHRANHSPSWVSSPRELVEMAVDGHSSDIIRQNAERLIEDCTVELNRAVFNLQHSFVGEGYQAASCEGCPVRVAKHRCGDKTCFEAKNKAWNELLIAQAVEVTGLAQAERPSYECENFYSEKVAGQQIINQGCPHGKLRLAVSNLCALPVQGLAEGGSTGVAYVCDYGHSRTCACLQKWQKDNNLEVVDSREMQQKRVEERYKRLVHVPARDALAKQFAAMSPAAWRLVVDHMIAGVKTGLPDDKLYSSLADLLLKGKAGYYWGEWRDIEDCRRQMDKFLAAIELTPEYPGLEPADTVEAIRYRFETIRHWLGQLAHRQPADEHLTQNIESLTRMRQQLLEANPGGNDGELLRQITAALVTLNGLSQVGVVEDFENVRGLFSRDNEVFARALTVASDRAADYVLQLLMVLEPEDHYRSMKIKARETAVEVAK